MSRRFKALSTIFFVATGIAFSLIATNSPTELLSLWLLYIALCTGGLGIVWTYRAGRSNGAFIMVNVALGFGIFGAQHFQLGGWVSAVSAVIAGLLVAFQPVLSPKIDQKFKYWDDRHEAPAMPRSPETLTTRVTSKRSSTATHTIPVGSAIGILIAQILFTAVAAGALFGLRLLANNSPEERTAIDAEPL
jgi:hypothetical protein